MSYISLVFLWATKSKYHHLTFGNFTSGVSTNQNTQTILLSQSPKNIHTTSSGKSLRAGMDFPKLCVNWIFLRKTAAGKAYLRFIFTHSVMCIRRIFPSASIDVHIFSTSNRFNNEAPNWIPVLYAIYVEKIHSNPNMWFPSCFTTIVDIVLWFDRKSPSSIHIIFSLCIPLCNVQFLKQIKYFCLH